ncbi:GlsB/YeaQ/YmgE family stress response membrane protein [Jannaschia rubra]|uniref:GlsB/YeaQ/YmgE family stress response membrane protein n=1 Tax=Jannaschia rubra TaxID=282197 RepID=UPI002491D7F7|nr:GlsB/YeaQ/YmgE family stress response membrane protein [Jannaschia rubra]
MEEFLQGLGMVAFTLLALTGLVVGALAGALTGRSKLLYALIGAVAAIATPFLLAALGITVLAAGGVLLVLVVGAVGAAVVVAIVRAVSRRV